MLAALSDYLPLADLAKIVAVCLVVAVVAPASVSLAIAGLDRRARTGSSEGDRALGIVLIVVGVAVLLALVAAGIYALDVH
ncbi:MAG TPA: hypothetical protein VKB43_06840 [Gaiellaceae bacterium]|nr:hypothetical protein [Gaiellaceae bacterium]